jgi:aspartate kinase
MKKIVMKFGGTSVGTGENIRHVAELVKKYAKNDCRVAVVVSALAGVTNSLVDIAEQAKKGDEKKIQAFTKELSEKHVVAVSKAIANKQLQKETEKIVVDTISELTKVLTGICYVGELTPKSKDYVLSFGERLSAPIVCGALRDLKFKSQFFTGKDAGIVTDSNFGEADPLMDFTAHRVGLTIVPLLDESVIPVVTGYIAADQDGVVTTLGRGGSDYTATILGAALGADDQRPEDYSVGEKAAAAVLSGSS